MVFPKFSQESPASSSTLTPRPFATYASGLLEGDIQRYHPHQSKLISLLRVMGAHGSNLDEILAEDMHHWYNKFMRESPSGLITLFELKNMLQMQGMTEEASSYVDQVFYTFDMDGVRESKLHLTQIKGGEL